MPDTEPVIDQVPLVDYIQRRARDNAIVRVHTFAAMTKSLKGEEITEIGLMQRAGAVGFTNGKSSVANTRVMQNVLKYARDFDALIVHHTEDPHLSAGTSMTSGEVATRLGLKGVSPVAEVILLDRDLRLVEVTQSRYHAAAITTKDSLDAIRAAKRKGQRVTCGVTINHLTLNENDIGSYRTFFKLRPPLRSEDERVNMVKGVAAGDIDVITSSHDPQDVDGKRRPFAEAADGSVGLETLLPAALRLHHAGDIALIPLLKAMTHKPSRIVGPRNRPPRKGRARRRDPRRPRRTMGRQQGPPALPFEKHRLRRSTPARPGVANACCRQHSVRVRWRTLEPDRLR